MNNQLALLIQLSDLDTQLEELNIERVRDKEAEIGFKMHARENEIKKMRDSIRKKIDDDKLVLYDKILKRYKMRAVTQVVEGVCYGCFMALPLQYVSDSEKNSRIITCPNCGRLLFWIE